jgi:hypothetical protein
MSAFLLTSVFVLLVGTVVADWLVVTSKEPREPMGPPISYR